MTGHRRDDSLRAARGIMAGVVLALVLWVSAGIVFGWQRVLMATVTLCAIAFCVGAVVVANEEGRNAGRH